MKGSRGIVGVETEGFGEVALLLRRGSRVCEEGIHSRERCSVGRRWCDETLPQHEMIWVTQVQTIFGFSISSMTKPDDVQRCSTVAVPSDSQVLPDS